jgi:Raf kinase inhibitor-like YbhB/YbcL family protein
MTFALTSPAFDPDGRIPARHTCDGEQVSPALAWSGAPAGVKSFALLMDDPDIPQVAKERFGVEAFDHWALFNIPADATGIAEGASAGTSGANTRGTSAYVGPCPPPDHEPREHRYLFRLYALDTMLDLPAGATQAAIRAAMAGHTLAIAELIGRYSRA